MRIDNMLKQRLIYSIAILLLTLGINAQHALYDQYGGRTDMKIEKGNGFFQLGKINGKHFFVTPEGNAFRSIGLNHSHTLTSTDYDAITADMKRMGFNSGDYQGPGWQWNRIPFSKGINLVETSSWLSESQFAFEDVFDSNFLSSLEEKIKNIVQPLANNKNLICYFFTDVPVWDREKYGSSWIQFYKSLDSASAGGKKWSAWKAANPNANEQDFVRIIARHLYANASAFIKKYDSNHLVFGDRHLEYFSFEPVLEESLVFIDGIAIQPKNFLNFEVYDEVYSKYKKPIFLCDHVTSFATEQYANTMGQVADNEEDYLEYYTWSVQSVMSKPYIVGYNKCQYQDEVNGGQLKQGLYKENGESYGYTDSLYAVHTKALDNAYTTPEIDIEGEAEKLCHWGKYEGLKKEAIERIDMYRKGDANLKLVLPNGDSAARVQIRATLKRHDFLWGAVVGQSFVNSPYSDVYKKIFLKYFNASGFNIALKPKWRGSAAENTAYTQTMPWFLKNDIYVRGHALTWEGYNFMRPEDKAIVDDDNLTDEEKADKLLESLGIHFSHAIPKWDVRCWDVSNEPMANNTVNNLLPDYNTHVHWFKLADSIRRVHGKEDVVLYQNDYQVISAITPWAMDQTIPGYNAKGRPAIYRAILDDMIAQGAPIEGIGFQSRLKQGLITPDSIYQRLLAFDRFNLPYQATEFEIRDDASKYTYTTAERRLQTEYMMVMYLSHPKVNGFWHWTFADQNSNTKLDYPLFNYDGSPKSNGRIWMDLMDGFFNTDVQTFTNEDGGTTIRGYYGRYEVRAEIDGKIYIGEFYIDSTNTDSQIVVQLDKGLQLSGLVDGAAYPIDEAIEIDVAAFSNYGDISSIGCYINNDSIAGNLDSLLNKSFTPGSGNKGWKKFIVNAYDTQGNMFSHTIDVYFGDVEPEIAFVVEPADTISQTSSGNGFTFRANETYAKIKTVEVSYGDRDFLYIDTTGLFFLSLDGLEVGDYSILIKVTDELGVSSTETWTFTVILPENVPPTIEITAPGEDEVFYYGNAPILRINAVDSDGAISSIEVYLNIALYHTFSNGPYNVNLGVLSVGEYSIHAIVTDDREGKAEDSVAFSIVDTTSSAFNGSQDAFTVYPNPAKHTLHFSEACDYEIFSLKGIRVMEGKLEKEVSIDGLHSGLYLIKTRYGVTKFSKE